MAGKLIYFEYDSEVDRRGLSLRPDIIDLDNDSADLLSEKLFRGPNQGQPLIVVSHKRKSSDNSPGLAVKVLEAIALRTGLEFCWCYNMENLVYALICV
jgi:hypothetical protein